MRYSAMANRWNAGDDDPMRPATLHDLAVHHPWFERPGWWVAILLILIAGVLAVVAR